MRDLYKAYKNDDRVKFFFVYVREAHPARKTTTDPKSRGPSGIGVHKTIQEKVLAAAKCLEGLKIRMPMLVDGMDGAAEKAYKGKPAATAVVDLEGKVVFHSVGPWGVQPKKAQDAIKKLIAKGGFPKKPPKATTRPVGSKSPAPAACTKAKEAAAAK